MHKTFGQCLGKLFCNRERLINTHRADVGDSFFVRCYTHIKRKTERPSRSGIGERSLPISRTMLCSRLPVYSRSLPAGISKTGCSLPCQEEWKLIYFLVITRTFDPHDHQTLWKCRPHSRHKVPSSDLQHSNLKDLPRAAAPLFALLSKLFVLATCKIS
jgi:hypothetical protein